MKDDPNEYLKFKDEAVRSREREEAISRLRMAAFLAFLGPLTIGLQRAFAFELQKWMVYGILGSAPLAIVVLIVNFIRVPTDSKTSPPVLMVGFLTLIGVVATFVLATYFHLLPSSPE